VTAAAFRQVRRRLGLTQAAFGALLALTPNTIARAERGEVPIRPQTVRLVRLVEYLAAKGDDYAEQLAAKGRGRWRT
jgi:transcriptional regulator with XRE-family HTH domain